MGYFDLVAAITIWTLLTIWVILHEDLVKALEIRAWRRIRAWRKDRRLNRIRKELTEAWLTVVPVEQTELRDRDRSCVDLIEDYFGR